MSRISAGWIVGVGTLVIPSCATRLTFHEHQRAAGASGGGASGGGGTAGRGATAGDSAGGRVVAVGGDDENGGGSAESGTPHTGGSSPSSAGKSSTDGGSKGILSTAGSDDNGGSPDDAGSGNTGSGTCGSDNCSGCCTHDGNCVTSPTAQACGTRGDACQPCTADQLCTNGACACPGTTHACGNACIDYSTSKDNCGSCGNACEAFQFCAGGKCLPHYVSTWVQPVTSGGDVGGVQSAAVFIDGTQDDLLLGLGGDLVLSAPGAPFTAELHGSGLARYAPDGTLVWSRNFNSLLGAANAVPTLLGNGDIGVGYLKYDPSGGPVAGTYTTRVSRVGGHTGDLVWEAKFPDKLTSSSATIRWLVSLPARQEIISFASPAQTFTLGGRIDQTTDLGSSGTVSALTSQNYIMDAASGADGATVWMWGAYDNGGSAMLNPWSSQTWQLTQNPFQFSGGDGYLLGARDDGSTTGPWFTEGDYGVMMKLLIDSDGDLIVAFTSGGPVTFNGGQELLPAGGCVLTKISHETGHIVWKTAISASTDQDVLPDQLVLAPGNRIVTANTSSAVLVNTLNFYSAADGSLLSSFSGAGVVHDGVIASGQTEMYLAGTVTNPTDFDPGAAADMLGATPGVFVSHFSFE